MIKQMIDTIFLCEYIITKILSTLLGLLDLIKSRIKLIGFFKWMDKYQGYWCNTKNKK